MLIQNQYVRHVEDGETLIKWQVVSSHIQKNGILSSRQYTALYCITLLVCFWRLCFEAFFSDFQTCLQLKFCNVVILTCTTCWFGSWLTML